MENNNTVEETTTEAKAFVFNPTPTTTVEEFEAAIEELKSGLKALKDSFLQEKAEEVLGLIEEEDRLGRKMYRQKDVAEILGVTVSFVAKTIKDKKDTDATQTKSEPNNKTDESTKTESNTEEV